MSKYNIETRIGTARPECMNCAYNCCCRCKRVEAGESCFYCSTNPSRRFTDFYGIRCCVAPDMAKYVCIDCKRCWKEPHIRRSSRQCDDKPYEGTRCSKCGKDGTRVSTSLRPPKYTDDKGWELLKFLSGGYKETPQYKKASKDSKIRNWRGIGGGVCRTDNYRKQFWIPIRWSEVKMWLDEMASSKYKSTG